MSVTVSPFLKFLFLLINWFSQLFSCRTIISLIKLKNKRPHRSPALEFLVTFYFIAYATGISILNLIWTPSEAPVLVQSLWLALTIYRIYTILEWFHSNSINCSFAVPEKNFLKIFHMYLFFDFEPLLGPWY